MQRHDFFMSSVINVVQNASASIMIIRFIVLMFSTHLYYVIEIFLNLMPKF